VAEEADFLGAAMDKYSGREARRRQEAADREELFARAGETQGEREEGHPSGRVMRQPWQPIDCLGLPPFACALLWVLWWWVLWLAIVEPALACVHPTRHHPLFLSAPTLLPLAVTGC
jgi:hypothetical protein